MKVSDSISGWNIEDLFNKTVKELIDIAKDSKKYSKDGLETQIELRLMDFFQHLPNGDHNSFIFHWKKEREYI